MGMQMEHEVLLGLLGIARIRGRLPRRIAGQVNLQDAIGARYDVCIDVENPRWITRPQRKFR